MKTIDIARRLMELGQVKKALEGFELALRLGEDMSPEDRMEAALFILQYGGDYKLSYQAFIELNHSGCYVDETRQVMTEAFYLPNEEDLRTRYRQNCKFLKKYPYFFRNDFVQFDELPIKFFPFDDRSYVPCIDGKFCDITNYSEPIITKNFFHDLEDPILAEDVYSQYELEYLNDNVRPSEWVSRENHVYLHYTNWAEFCSYLQVINLHKLLADKKFVFLMEDEIKRYPIDFKSEFGIDYGQFPLKPIGLREINRLIWHTQLSYHNGGDYFNQIYDGHPNLICSSSIMNDTIIQEIDAIRSVLDHVKSWQKVCEAFDNLDWDDKRMIYDLYRLKDRTDKDILVAFLCRDSKYTHHLDAHSRISPAIFYQPHFGYIATSLTGDSQGRAVMDSSQLKELCHSSIFQNFKYIKTFIPMRRFTTSYAASICFMANQSDLSSSECQGVAADEIVSRVTFRGYMVDKRERVWKDSIVIRFEDAKLNPLAAFTALTEFLDIPVTRSMYTCTIDGEPQEYEGSGFDTSPVYRTYNDFATDAERCYIEYFLRDAYQHYCYDFNYYDGSPMNEARVKDLISHFDVLNHYMRTTIRLKYLETAESARGQQNIMVDENVKDEALSEEADRKTEIYMAEANEKRIFAAKVLMEGLQFLNIEGKPLEFVPLLKLDPALMVQPLYH